MTPVRLSTDQIILAVTNDHYPSQEWQDRIEAYTSGREEETDDAITSARFLESWSPGQKWSAREFAGLLNNHLTMRWLTAAHYAIVRAREEHEDGNISDERLAEITKTDDACIKWARGESGVHFFEDTDNSYVIFTDLHASINVADD